MDTHITVYRQGFRKYLAQMRMENAFLSCVFPPEISDRIESHIQG